MSVRLSKEESEKQLDMRKETVKRVCLKKADMTGLISRVAVVLDVSGSMIEAFNSGMVQATLERLLPLAMAFDDDGSMEVWTFDHEFKRYPPITRGNFYNYIKDNKITARGGTYYSPVMSDVGVYFSKEEPADIPNYVIFVTDGDNADERATDNAIKYISHFPIFFQFVGIGNTRPNAFHYLRKLDDMNGRYVDNANFFSIESLADINIIDDAELYTKLLDEYPKWLSYPQVKQMIANGRNIAQTNKKQLKKLENLAKSDPTERGGFSKYSNALDIIADIVDILLDALG
ncbi:VWA domain-containing protein [uncultured Ruminococcus sp.]|uniref:VWA domain-containing protein n=1 Tax=uncultured Ruminococcus sp. TaxID=165186 RepID=UPI0025EFD213|nr:VWA domain-containing protein [uncultured Ruminococcus sp.]